VNQYDLERQVALATGETVRTVSKLGFSLADPEMTDHDPEPSDIEDLIVDWDDLDARRNTPVFAA
jgi:hypothetical protein